MTECVWIDGASMPYVDQHLDVLANGPFEPVFEFRDGCAARKGEESPTHIRTIGRGLVSEG